MIERLSGRIDLPVSNSSELERRVIHGENTQKVSVASLTLEERQQVLQTHFKFMILRDPVERLLSAYKDKVCVSSPAPPVSNCLLSTQFFLD